MRTQQARRTEHPVRQRPACGAHLALAMILLAAAAGCGQVISDPDTVRIWHWMTDREETFKELAQRYEEERGVPVHFALYAPSDLYVQKVRAAAQTDGLPDIFGVLGEMRDLASFIRAGHVLDLSDAMEEGEDWDERFFPLALNMNRFRRGNVYDVEPGIYGVPLDVMNVQIFYNKRLLAKLGLDPEQPPRTWEEFLAVGQLARDHGLLGFVSGWAELWLVHCFAMNAAIHLMGDHNVEKTFRGQIAYTDPRWLEVLALFEQMRDSGLPADGVVTMVNKRAEQLFANEQAVFAFNGTWGVNVYRNMNPRLEYGVMMPPVIREGRRTVTWGGAGSSLLVNAQSPRREQALAFLRWLTDDAQQRFLLEATHNIPANRHAAIELPADLAAFADDMEAVVHPRLLAVQEYSVVIEALDKGIQSILIGEETPQEVMERVQQIKEREERRVNSRQSADARAPARRTHAIP